MTEVSPHLRAEFRPCLFPRFTCGVSEWRCDGLRVWGERPANLPDQRERAPKVAVRLARGPDPRIAQPEELGPKFALEACQIAGHVPARTVESLVFCIMHPLGDDRLVRTGDPLGLIELAGDQERPRLLVGL